MISIKINNMKKLIFLLIPIIFIASCKDDDKKPGTVLVTPITDTSKIIDTTIEEPGIAPIADSDPTGRKMDKPDREEKQKKIKISCSFNQKEFNKRKRPITEAPGGVKGKPPRKPKPTDPPPPPDDPNPPPPPDPPPPTGTNVIYINYFGKTVSGTMWNTNGTFTVGDAGLAQTEMDYIKGQVLLHYTAYNVVITYDQAVFDAAPEGTKVEILVTEDWQWYGQAGGVAYINSFFWTDATPAFVFSLLLNYNGHNIAEAIAHEAGHTLGLRHQSDCSGGVVTNQYSNGKTMGVSYYVPLGAWVTGTSSLSCAIQNDTEKLTTALGQKQMAYIRKNLLTN